MTGAGAEDAAIVEHRGNVLLITINRPRARNAVNGAVSTAIGEALSRAESDPEIRVVVITGAGDQAFCAGADLKAISRGENLFAEGHEEWGFGGFVRHFVSVPTIAAVNGFALGGGTELALACDLVVASESATFGLPEVKRGLIAGAGGVFRLPQQMPHRVALEMILTGEPIGAMQAREWGLVNAVTPEGGALDAALDLAARIASNAPLSVQASKRLAYGVVEGQVGREDESWELSTVEFTALLQTEDAHEGPLAFAEKREPQWKAR